jgi:hypothetical protein
LQVPLSQEVKLSQVIAVTIAPPAMAFGILATVLAGIGLYGILAYSTASAHGKSAYEWHLEHSAGW